ncbi:3-dehydroquinate synthase [Bizionia argentinensis JUB59]|uniref:3-dehydroquinate synthase n=1 Tax=Bizionia argentinensis JUB59 TaxID=1046627 RepID=G2E998_9FLAO|nr:3-dehydroquinate synthase [Bizionia argentinensis]EGV45079.1 3-dehydroquinate synthase [Bizionia argentinensis JUB59]
MKSIQTENYSIHFNSNCYSALNTHLKAINYSILFILVDENTHNFCLPQFIEQIETSCTIEIIEIEAGEEHKTIETCVGVWNALSELGADRKSLIINLGGGVVTDLGGFVASTFKRGLNYINVPTSLLAMVDASVGGKTGVDLGHLKNQIGVINPGEMVLIDTNFLETLPENQLRSGLAEMLKHGLIYSRDYWNKFSTDAISDYDNLIYESVIIKNSIVTKDPLEQNLRKTLNYGHTLGHAIESYFLSHPEKEALLHGEAIAVGMILATYISTELSDFPKSENEAIKKVIKRVFGEVTFSPTDYDAIIELLKYDKKNEHGNINFVLLENMGKPIIDCQVSNELIIKAFEYYRA